MGAFDVSSSFKYEANQTITDKFKRRFTIGSSDYSEFVRKWPRIKRAWNDIKPNSITIGLNNEEGTFNFFETMKTNIVIDCTLEAGFETSSGDEYVTLHKGKINRVKYKDAMLTLTIKDKIKPFSELIVGNNDAPIEFLNSNYLPSDIAWWLATSYGGLDGVMSSSNVDIDYESFAMWAGVFSSDNVFVQARFDGQKLNECFRKIGRMTRSAISVEDDLLTFARYDISSVDPLTINSGDNVSLTATIDDSKIVNKQFVHANYSISSDSFSTVVNDVSSSSVNSYGLHENLLEDKSFWYVNSISALNIAQRQITINADAYTDYSIELGMQPLYKQLGETMRISDTLLGISNSLFRIMGYDFDLDKAKSTIDCDASQILTFFRLDVDSMDGGAGRPVLG